MSGERVLVTGARGYLGARLLGQLPGALALCADITDPQALARAFAAVGPADALVHLAAADEIVCANDLARGFEVNCVGTRNVLESAAAAGVRRIVFLSSFHVYGEPVEGSAIDEATVPDPLHPYGITKLAAEQLCKAASRRHGFELAIVRLSNGVGAPADSGNARWTLVVPDLCRQAQERGVLTLRSSGLQGRDFVSIDDTAAALRLLLDADAMQLRQPVFNLGSGVTVRVRDVARMIQEEYQALYGVAIALFAPEPSGPAPSLFTYDIRRMAALGFAPQSDLRAEIRQTLQFCERFRAERT
jgi:UDP-glucose 4-epimerase